MRRAAAHRSRLIWRVSISAAVASAAVLLRCRGTGRGSPEAAAEPDQRPAQQRRGTEGASWPSRSACCRPSSSRPSPSCTPWPRRPNWPSRGSPTPLASCRKRRQRAAEPRRPRCSPPRRAIVTARHNLTSYVRNSYMSPPVGSTTIGLLTASDPNALLQGGDYQQYVSAHHLDAMGALDRATIAKSNADAAARLAEQVQQQLTVAAAQAQKAAQPAYAAEQAQTAHFQQQQVAVRPAAGRRPAAAGNPEQPAGHSSSPTSSQQALIAAAKARAEAEAAGQGRSGRKPGAQQPSANRTTAATQGESQQRWRRYVPCRAERRQLERAARGARPRPRRSASSGCPTPGPAAATSARPTAWTRPAPTAGTTARCSASTAPA